MVCNDNYVTGVIHILIIAHLPKRKQGIQGIPSRCQMPVLSGRIDFDLYSTTSIFFLQKSSRNTAKMVKIWRSLKILEICYLKHALF